MPRCLGRKKETVPVKLYCGSKLAPRHRLILPGCLLGALLWVGFGELSQQLLRQVQKDGGRL